MRVSLPRFVILATSIFLFVGLGSLLAWAGTGRMECARAFFRGPGAAYLVFLTLIEFSLCRMALRQFLEGEPLRPAWFLLTLSSGCNIVSAVCVQILGVPSALSSPTLAADFYRFGILAGGPLRMLLLAGGVGWMLRLSRRRGTLWRFHLSSWIPLWITALYTYVRAADLAGAVQGGGDVSFYDVIVNSTGPLQLVLLVQSAMVRSRMSSAGGGLIARCWNSLAAAISLSVLGNLAGWMDSQGLLPAGLATVSCFLAYLAATAYVLAPAWQIEAIQRACGEIGVARFSPLATSLSALRLLNTARTH
jgi:hypothetical protein